MIRRVSGRTISVETVRVRSSSGRLDSSGRKAKEIRLIKTNTSGQVMSAIFQRGGGFGPIAGGVKEGRPRREWFREWSSIETFSLSAERRRWQSTTILAARRGIDVHAGPSG